MTALLEIYRAQFRNTIAVQLQYRAALVIWLIGAIVQPLIYLVVWGTVARTNGGTVSGYHPGDFAAYFIVLMLVNQATMTWVFYEFEWRIRQGMFSPKLLRPLHPIHADIADNITYKLITLPVMLGAAAILAVLFHPTPHPAPWAVVLFVPALALAFLVRFLVEWTLALAAFWTTRTNAVNQMYYVALLFLSGQIAPLAFFPLPVRVLAAVLPFRWTVAFPVELVLGRLTLRDALAGLGVQCIWAVLAVAILALVWRAGVRRYSAVGA